MNDYQPDEHIAALAEDYLHWVEDQIMAEMHAENGRHARRDESPWGRFSSAPPMPPMAPYDQQDEWDPGLPETDGVLQKIVRWWAGVNLQRRHWE